MFKVGPALVDKATGVAKTLLMRKLSAGALVVSPNAHRMVGLCRFRQLVLVI